MTLNTPLENFDLYSYFRRLVSQIPEGKVASYAEMARALGDHVSAVACAYMQWVLKKEKYTPMHRLIRSGGDIGGYYSTEEIRQNSSLLRDEGLTVTSGKVKFLKDRWFTDFETDYPLAGMKEEQSKMAERASFEDDFDPDSIGAVDVSYDPLKGYASFVYEEDGESIGNDTVMDATFPYIPGYLFYREYRFVKKLAKNFDGTLFIDGNGMLHPRFFGLATATGVYLDKATLGVAKSLLLGKVRRNWVVYQDRTVGYMLNKNTIISPGHRISLESGVDLVKERYNNSYPEILRSAHKGTVRLRKSYTGTLEAK